MLIDKKAPWYDKIEIAMIIVIFSILTVILFVNVVTRFCFHYTATWSEQAARYLFVWMTFAGVSLAGKTSSHLQVTVANMVFGEERAKTVFLIGDVIVVLFGCLLTYKIFGVMMRVMSTGQVFPAMTWLPSWTLYLSGVLGMAGFTLRVIQRRYRTSVAAKHKEA